MALGKVSVRNLNLGQGAVSEIERYFLFIGTGVANTGKVLALNTSSDLDVDLGAEDSELKTQIIAARQNGGDRWACAAVPMALIDDWDAAVDLAMREVSPEAIVITIPVTTGAELSAMHDKAISIENQYGRRVFFMAATAGIEAEQDWSGYLAAQKAIVDGLAAPRVLVVPQLHGNNLGVLAGRLANAAVSIADSPMRVATGAVMGLGATPVDVNNIPLPSATLSELDKARFSVPQTYPDYPGVFWGDGNMLDAPGSDFQVVEYLRIADKAARRVRLLLIQRVANRAVNNTPNSMAATKSALMKPLREMGRSVLFMGLQFPGDIEPPKDGDIELVWMSKTKVDAYIKVRPYNCPKDLTANIALDLSTEEQ